MRSHRGIAPASIPSFRCLHSEEQDLELTRESDAAKSHGTGFISFPIEDQKTPTSRQNMGQLVEKMDAKLSEGQSLVVHCRQVIGRSGLIAACLLIARGWSPQGATQKLNEVSRGSHTRDH
jgi:protein-tyrosine phosphatase